MWQPGENTAMPSGNKAPSHAETGQTLSADDKALIEKFVRNDAIAEIKNGSNFSTRYNKSPKQGLTGTLMFDADANGVVYRVCMNLHQHSWGAIWVTIKSRAMPELEAEELPFEDPIEDNQKKEIRKGIKAKYTHELHPAKEPRHNKTAEDRKVAIAAFRRHYNKNTCFGSPLIE